MADSLGEKLREAREERDISISEVAEQTRISAQYLKAIEEDDYSTLPGGIFNKGFVKSFAKYVGLDEQEALQDYAIIIESDNSSDSDSDTHGYRPEVLTDDLSGGSKLLTIIIAVIILGLMAWGILTLVGYVQSAESGIGISDNSNVSITNSGSPTSSNSANSAKIAEKLPPTDSITLRISSSADELSVDVTADGKRETILLNRGVTARIVEAKDSLKLSYYKGLADKVELELNGKKVTAPLPPVNYRKVGLEYEINLENIKKILQDGKIEMGGPSAGTN